MKRLLLASALTLVYSAPAAAQEVANIDCSTLHVGLLQLLQYTIKGIFPNPSQNIYKNLASENTSFNSCGYDINSKDGVITVKAPTIKALLNILGSTTRENPTFNFDPVSISGYKYPALKQDFMYFGFTLKINPSTFEVSTPSTSPLTSFKENTIGYKINNGPILPYFYDGIVTPFKFDKDAKVLDFYTKKEKYQDGNGRISIDLVNNSVTVWKDFPFPNQ